VIPAGARPEPGAQAAKRAVILYGPTAGGKSALAIELAARLDGVIINADSLQLYAELEILTARPDAEALRQAPHRLYGTLPAAEAGSAARWRDWALAEIATALDAGKLPIVTGGTGLYLTALVQGLSPLPSADEAARAEATALYARLGGAAFRAALGKRDPAAAARLEPGDRQRLIRAWEVVEATGTPLSDWQALPREPGHGLRFRLIGLMPERAELYRRIDHRFETMLAQGALQEAARFEALGLPATLPANRALGLKELRSHLKGEITLVEATRQAQQATRNYAKRQVTWFRHQLPGEKKDAGAHNLHAQFTELSERNLAEIISFILHPG
jgi:tRNA dimethylallyltransferase